MRNAYPCYPAEVGSATMRLNKYLGESGQWSRREADALIEEGRVTINGVPAPLGAQVAAGDEVKVDGDLVGKARKLERPVYIALNKPIGITCTTERHVEGNIIDFVDHPERIFPIGRLDKESEGLILLTNDGDFAQRLAHPSYEVEKTYVAEVTGRVDKRTVRTLLAGVTLEDGPVEVRRARVVSSTADRGIVELVIHEGRNRIVRRLLAEIGHPVQRLTRTAIGPVRIGTLKQGTLRELSTDEVGSLLDTAGL